MGVVGWLGAGREGGSQLGALPQDTDTDSWSSEISGQKQRLCF